MILFHSYSKNCTMELMLKTETFSYRPISDKEFVRIAKALAPVSVPLEQSPIWGTFDNAIDGRKFLGSFRYDDQNGKLIALGSATFYQQKGRSWIWFKHGPLFAQVPNTETVKKMCATLKAQFGSHEIKPVFVRLSCATQAPPLRLPYEHTMYDETVVANLAQSEEELFAGMSQSGRQGVRKALKTEVTVREITTDPAKFFAKYCYPILQETGTRDGFGIHPLHLYEHFLNNLDGIARLYVSGIRDDVEAWAITTEYSDTAMYYYGGSSAKARETSAAYLLHWEIMKKMKDRGNKRYDFMGIAGEHYPALRNVTQFKTKFTKNFVKVPVTYDLPLSALRYEALRTLIKLKRKIL